MAATAIQLMTFFGVKDSNTEQENLSYFISVSNTQHGEDLCLLVRKFWDNSSTSDATLLMTGILSLMWAKIKDIGENIILLTCHTMQIILSNCHLKIIFA